MAEKKLFGTGKLVKNENGEIDWAKSDFVSKYAASNASEDFAETFTYLIMNYIVSPAIGVEDLWKITDEDLERDLNTNSIAHKIWEKAKIIIKAYLRAVSEEKRKDTDWQNEQSKCVCNNGKPALAVLLCNPDILRIEVSRSLLALVDPSLGCELLNNIVHVRRRIALEVGIVLPGIRVRDNTDLSSNRYVVKINDQQIESGEVMKDQLLIIGPENILSELGTNIIKVPGYETPAVWAAKELRAKAESFGCQCFTPTAVISNHLAQIVKLHATKFVGIQEVGAMVDNVKKTHPLLVKSLIPKHLSYINLKTILHNLLKDSISIHGLVTILETIANHINVTNDPAALTECVRKVITTRFDCASPDAKLS